MQDNRNKLMSANTAVALLAMATPLLWGQSMVSKISLLVIYSYIIPHIWPYTFSYVSK